MPPRITYLFAAAACVGALACSNQKTPVPGKACIINSDCEDPLSCSFGKCHEACRANGDCPSGQRCVWTGPPASAAPDAGMGLRVCLLDPRCAQDSFCPDPLVCGRDLQCRNECEADRDCTRSTDRCVVGGQNGEKVCAEPEAIGTNGELKPDPDAGMKEADASPQADAADAGAGDAASDTSADTKADVIDTTVDGPRAEVDAITTDGGDDDGPRDAQSLDGSATPDSGVEADAPADAPRDAGSPEAAPSDAAPMVVPEMEPNDDHLTPMTYMIGTAVQGTSSSASDLDYFEVTAPATDPAGGFFQASIAGVGAGTIFAEVYTVTDNGVILLADGARTAQSFSFYWGARPGLKYQVKVYRGGSAPAPFAYTLNVNYTKVDDPSEPNDTRNTARPIALGTPVAAYFFSGFSAAATPVLDEDWFSVVLNTGVTTVSARNVPADLRLQFAVYDLDFNGVPTTGAVGANAGANINGTFTVNAPGTYRVQFLAKGFLSTVNIAGSGVTLPDSFTTPYTVTITQ